MSTVPDPDVTAPAPRRRGHRLWIPIGITLLVVAGIVALERAPDLERNFRIWEQWMLAALGLALTFLWFLFLSRLRWRYRLFGLALVCGVAFGLSRVVRVAGTIDGRGLPRLAWKSSAPRPESSAAPPPATPRPAAAPLASSPALGEVRQFFGPRRDGSITGARLARDWTATPPKELWRQPVGAGWSAFAVANGRAFTQEQRGDLECVTCYEALTGRLLWAHTNSVHFAEWQGGDGPRATPTIEGGRLYALGATGILNCLDPETGTIVWSRDVFAEHHLPNLKWGASGSPLVFDDLVVVPGGLGAGPTLLAFDRTTGAPRWQAGSDKAAYASPLLATLAGRRLILSFNATALTGHDPVRGDVLLNHTWGTDKWPKAAQPVVVGTNRVFVSAGYGMGCELLEVAAAGDVLSVKSVWKNQRLKTQFNSAALREGHLYGLDDGFLACVEVTTGERRWKDGRFGSGQSLVVDDLILVQSEPGDVVLAEAKPYGYRELGRIRALSAKTWNYPTLAGRVLLVRNDREAAAYELPAAPP